MWLDGIGFAQPLEDPSKSRVVGKVGYGVMPRGPKAQVSAMFGDGEGISSFSKKKGPSWFYLQWASNKQNQFACCRRPRVRRSATPRIRRQRPLATQGSERVDRVHADIGEHRAARTADHRPVTEFRDVFGIALTNMINGADPAPS
jgi:multiple sugar transport system substrate-binding protein